MKKLWLYVALACGGILSTGFPAFAADIPEQSTELEDSTNPIRFVPQASIVMPTQFELSHGGYAVSYSDTVNGIPVFYLGFTSHLARLGDFHFSLLGRAGYSYSFGPAPVKNAQGLTANETVQLSWVPLAGGVKLAYEVPTMRFLRPSLSFGAGAHFLHQSSDRPELDATFWIPYLFLSPGVTFFEGGTDFFNGFTFGLTYQSSLSSTQFVRGWSFDLSVNFIF